MTSVKSNGKGYVLVAVARLPHGEMFFTDGEGGQLK